jgi:hypothetical protein
VMAVMRLWKEISAINKIRKYAYFLYTHDGKKRHTGHSDDLKHNVTFVERREKSITKFF